MKTEELNFAREILVEFVLNLKNWVGQKLSSYEKK